MNYNKTPPKGKLIQRKYKAFIDNYHRLRSQSMDGSSKEYEFMKLDALLNKREIQDYLLELNHKFGISNVYENMIDSYSTIVAEIEGKQQASATKESAFSDIKELSKHVKK